MLLAVVASALWACFFSPAKPKQDKEADKEHQGPSTPWWRRAWEGFKTTVVSAINPRLVIFENGLLLALVVMSLTLISVALLAVLLRIQSCRDICTTIPLQVSCVMLAHLFAITDCPPTLTWLSCCLDHALQYVQVDDSSVCTSVPLTNKLPGFDGVASQGVLASDATLGKCSILHSNQCAISDWSTVLQCARDLSAWLATQAQTSTVLTASSWESVGVSMTASALGWSRHVHLPAPATSLAASDSRSPLQSP